MKKSDHKTDTVAVLQFLLAGPQYAVDVGDYFWPDKASHGPSRGGPSSTAVAAGWLLGKLRRKKLVDREYREDQPNYRKWSLTNLGHEYLRNQT